MEKYVFTDTGKSVELGDFLVNKVTRGDVSLVSYKKITKEILEALLKGGIISEVKDESKEVKDITLDTCLESLAKRINWDVDNVYRYIDRLSGISMSAVVSVLLREVAIALDKQYPDHIENSKEIWVISMLNGEISRVKDLNRIKNFRNFSAFRNLEDAKYAKALMQPYFKQMFEKHDK